MLKSSSGTPRWDPESKWLGRPPNGPSLRCKWPIEWQASRRKLRHGTEIGASWITRRCPPDVPRRQCRSPFAKMTCPRLWGCGKILPKGGGDESIANTPDGLTDRILKTIIEIRDRECGSVHIWVSREPYYAKFAGTMHAWYLGIDASRSNEYPQHGMEINT